MLPISCSEQSANFNNLEADTEDFTNKLKMEDEPLVKCELPKYILSKSFISATVLKSHSLVNMKQEAKKLVIKNFRSEPTLPENYLEVTWEKLQNAVVAIQNSTAIQYSLEELYQAVENLCNFKMASRVYGGLEDLTVAHITRSIETFHDDTSDRNSFLKKMNSWWQSHCNQMTMIRSIFLYLDRTYVLQNPTVQSVWDLGIELLRRIMLHHPVILNRAADGLLSLIAEERLGKATQEARDL